jgi:hypothetical protein
MFNRRGSKYEETKSLALKEIAKLVRAEINERQKSGSIAKHLKISVRQTPGSLYVVVKDGDFDAHCGNVDDVEFVVTARKQIAEIVEQYNFDESRIEADYFHRRFFWDFQVSWRPEKQLQS